MTSDVVDASEQVGKPPAKDEKAAEPAVPNQPVVDKAAKKPQEILVEKALGDLDIRPAKEIKGTGEERREFCRRPFRLRLMLAYGSQIYHGRTDDVSETGASIRVDILLHEKARIDIRFLSPFLEGMDHFDISGEVRYAVMTSGDPACRIGVQFINPGSTFQHWFKQVMQG